jgi:hypothetical protein
MKSLSVEDNIFVDSCAHHVEPSRRKKAKTLEASDQFKLSPANISYGSLLLYFGRKNEQHPEMETVLTVEFAEFIDRGELLMLR